MCRSLIFTLFVFLQFPVLPCRAQVAGEPRSVSASRAAAAGIRRLESQHLTLFTDLPGDAEVDELPAVFDRAVLEWAKYFEIPPERLRDWRMQGYLIGDRSKFESLELMPEGHEGFRHGFSLGRELWLYEQPTPYYRRHLLLHEGTHGFMASQLGGCGAGWYMEGMAELLATHKWDARSRELTLRHMPASRREVPMLGRIKLIRDAYAENRALGPVGVLAIDNRRFLDSSEYAWCWALARLLDDHPRYHARFRSLREIVRAADFNDQFRDLYADDWADLSVEWQLLVSTLEHGHDVARNAIEFRDGVPLDQSPVNVKVDTGRGWQSTSVRLEAGRRYRVGAEGRFELNRDEDGIWWCEPGGVTIEYYRGNPLGMLIGAIDIRDAQSPTAATSFLRPVAIGAGRELAPKQSGTLYLRVNDSPAQLSDNVGSVSVKIEVL
jgi:hypothetical protein